MNGMSLKNTGKKITASTKKILNAFTLTIELFPELQLNILEWFVKDIADLL